MRLFFAILCSFITLTMGGMAGAQERVPPQPAERAAQLFSTGLEAMKEERWDVACPAIAESYALEPLPGALFTLAECRARAGRVASAMRDFNRYLELVEAMPVEEQTKQRERVDVTRRRQREIAPRIPRMTVEIAGEVPAGAVIELDGKRLGADELGRPLPLDPGPHRVLVRVGTLESDASVTLGEGELRRVRLAVPQAPPPPPPVVVPAPPPLPEPDESQPVPPAETSAWWVAGWMGVGLGSVGLVVAATAGLVLLGKKSTIDANCTGTICNDIGLAEAEDVPTLDSLGTSAFVVGAVLSAAGAIVLLASSTSDATPGDSPVSGSGWPLRITW